jgi:hypothetical protein
MPELRFIVSIGWWFGLAGLAAVAALASTSLGVRSARPPKESVTAV